MRKGDDGWARVVMSGREWVCVREGGDGWSRVAVGGRGW